MKHELRGKLARQAKSVERGVECGVESVKCEV